MTFGQGLLRRLPFSASTTPLQALTYLLGISLFSISFLVFLNSSVSFVITDLIGIKDGVGDIVGTLGFVDEIVVLIACPIWGLVSDRSGVRYVAVFGYATIGLSLFLFVQAHNVYPQLLLARILFAVGAAAVTTMVTAILPSLTDETGPAAEIPRGPVSPGGRPSVTLSVDSEATITPERFRGDNDQTSTNGEEPPMGSQGKGKSSALAGYVGLFTGCGALVALVLFLPLPARFSHVDGVTFADAIQDSFYIVGTISFLVAIFVFFGLRGLRGEEGKGFRMLFGSRASTSQGTGGSNSSAFIKNKILPYHHLLKRALQLGFTDHDIALGYLGGFVARASTVAISLFLPLFVNTYFFSRGFCQGSPTDPSPELKKECRQAYVLSSILAGVAQLVGLVCAPLFGYLASRRARVNWPIVVSAVLGIVGYVAFPMLESPEYKDVEGRGGSPVVFLLAALMGVSQIGAIVCSLGSLGRGVLKVEVVNVLARVDGERETLIEDADGEGDTAPLLENSAALPEDTVSRVRLKGSVAGVYSWFGGAAILLLTKLGGYLFDAWSTGAPFYLMAVFNGVLLLASIAIDVSRAAGARRRHHLL
ncbi:hypothetical protein F5144DRAFT_619517 [Chaetomium tenue]|uniref:Uncharacterized protein n=1 Tax=Chaetomium tenue TaxID=1854479 RepID=A0ACB7PA53_9PEZI|nr:hypothetical protein F5144DRAFT_619517 [Chaetomium globosum]